MKRYLLLLLGIMIAAITVASDVITKKNGTAIQCKVMKVGRTEVEYKNITNLDGPVYAIDLTEIVSITYENGTADKFGEQSVVTTNAGHRTASDAELMMMYNQMNSVQHYYKVWKTSGCVLGVLGAAAVTWGIVFNAWYGCDDIEIGPVIACYSGGAAFLAGGYYCYRKGHNMQKQAQRYSCSPIFEQDFQLGNNTMLSADVNMFNDNSTHDKSLGLGIRFTF